MDFTGLGRNFLIALCEEQQEELDHYRSSGICLPGWWCECGAFQRTVKMQDRLQNACHPFGSRIRLNRFAVIASDGRKEKRTMRDYLKVGSTVRIAAEGNRHDGKLGLITHVLDGGVFIVELIASGEAICRTTRSLTECEQCMSLMHDDRCELASHHDGMHQKGPAEWEGQRR